MGESVEWVHVFEEGSSVTHTSCFGRRLLDFRGFHQVFTSSSNHVGRSFSLSVYFRVRQRRTPWYVQEKHQTMEKQMQTMTNN